MLITNAELVPSRNIPLQYIGILTSLIGRLILIQNESTHLTRPSSMRGALKQHLWKDWVMLRTIHVRITFTTEAKREITSACQPKFDTFNFRRNNYFIFKIGAAIEK